MNDLQWQIRARIGLIYIAMLAAQIDTALSYVEIAKNTAHSINDTGGLIELCDRKSFCSTNNGDLENEIASSEEALSFCSSTRVAYLFPLIVALHDYNLACIGQLDRVRIEMEKAIPAAKSNGNKYGLQCPIINTGTTYWFGLFTDMRGSIEKKG